MFMQQKSKNIFLPRYYCNSQVLMIIRLWFQCTKISLFLSAKMLYHLYLITYLLLFGDDKLIFSSFVFLSHSPSVLPMTNLPMHPLFSELQQHPSAVCAAPVWLPPYRCLSSHFSSSSSSFSTLLRPQAAAAMSMLTAVSFPIRCSGGVKDMENGVWLSCWYQQPETEVGEMCQVPGAHRER